MNEKKLRWIIYFLIVAILSFMMIFVGHISKTMNFSKYFMIVFNSTIFNALILVVAYAAFRKIRTFVFWKIAVYFVLIAIGSSFVVILLYIRGIYTMPFLIPYGFFVVGGFLFLLFLNYVLLRIIFAVNLEKSFLIGTLISLINIIFLLPPINK